LFTKPWATVEASLNETVSTPTDMQGSIIIMKAVVSNAGNNQAVIGASRLQQLFFIVRDI